MKCGLRLVLCTLTILFLPLFFLFSHLWDLYDQYDVGSYAKSYLGSSWGFDSYHGTPHGTTAGDKVIVMAKLEEEDTSWVKEELPDWRRAIYTVNPSPESLADPNVLKTPMNKGHEAMAYLTYVIDNYDRFPSTVAFLHSHRSGFLQAWHVDAPLHDNVAAMKLLQLDFVQQNGYVNLRCNWNPGCKKAHRKNKHITEDVWWEIFEGTSTPPLNTTEAALYPEKAQSVPGSESQKPLRVPDEVGTACCAQFAVSRDQILKRPLEDYVKFQKWVMETEKNDASSGRVMEFLWHVIFGKDAIYCPDEELCYCQVYGRC